MPAIIVDDTDPVNFNPGGFESPGAPGLVGGYGGSVQTSLVGPVGEFSGPYWYFGGLNFGESYRVAVSWLADPANGSDFQYAKNTNGFNELISQKVDQKQEPDSFVYGGVGWKIIDEVMEEGGGIYIKAPIDQEAHATGFDGSYFVVDAVMLIPSSESNPSDPPQSSALTSRVMSAVGMGVGL